MDREQIEKAISHYEELLADKEHFERLRPQFTKGAVANRKRWLKIKNQRIKGVTGKWN
jgi:hypothetical protein|nr:MAG TPA: hypothetical protein [Caudoviricetes sp.]